MTKDVSAALPLIDRMTTILVQSKDDNDRQFVTALGRGLTLLAAFEQHEQLSHQQLCQMTTLPKATITRRIHTLMTLGFLRMTEHAQ